MSESLLWTAFWLGIVSAASLPMGALVSHYWTPSDRMTAVLMAFGGGALLAALTIDLVGSALEKGHFNALAIGAVGGGLLFVLLNQVVNDAGGFLRKTSTTFYHLRRQEHRRIKRIITQVARSDLFTGLSESDYKALAASFASVDFPKGSAIFEAGDPPDAAYIVAAGEVEIFDRADRTKPLLRIGPNHAFGWYSTITGCPTSDTAIAATDSTVWIIPKETLDGLQRSSAAYVQIVHRELRSPQTLAYLIERQGMTAEAAGTWLDQAAQSLMRSGRIPRPEPALPQGDGYLRRLPEVRRFPFFSGLPADELDLIANRLIFKLHAEGENLFVQGQPASRLFLLERGRVSLIDPQHSYQEPAALGEDDALGGLSFLTGAKHTTTAVAIEDCATWELRRSDLDDLLRRAPRFAERIRAFVVGGEAASYLTSRLHLQADKASRWCRAAERALDQRQPIPPAAALTLDHAQHGGAPIAIFLGITLDGIPESLVIGSSMLHAAISVSLIVGLFLSNFPEALSSSVGMRQQGMGFWRIFGMWSALMLITGIGATAGSVFFEGAGPRQPPQNNVTLAVACASLRRYSRITPSTKLIEMEKAETQLTDAVIRTIRDAARKLTGPKRRQFQAQVALDYFGGSARKAQTVFGWSGKTVALGLNELRTGITCVDSFAMRGRRKSEDAQPQLLEDIVALVEPQSQTDPKFQGRFQYTRMTAKAVRQALIDEKDWTDEQLPHENTIGVILNRLGYRLRRVQKRKPIKRVKETDAIFETVHEENKKSDQRDDSLRISIDTKAKVNVGPFSRHGQSRGAGAVEAADHDFEPEHKLVPFGILDVMAGWLTIIFGTSRETSDFIVDCLQQWWHDNQGRYGHITQLVINLDNGPELQSRRTQFMARMVEFAEQTGLEIVLVYYPPYHSKYNPIERCWGILEMHWNGSLLDSIETVCDWARTMTWKRIAPAVRLLDRVYEKGVSLTKQAFEAIERRLQRDERLPKYHVVIQPTIA